MNNPEDTKPRKRQFGRRKSDWILPTTLFAVALLAFLWAFDSYQKREQIDEVNRALKSQTKLLERIIEEREADRKAAPTPVVIAPVEIPDETTVSGTPTPVKPTPLTATTVPPAPPTAPG